MRFDPFVFVWGILMAIALWFTVRYLWPLILVVLLVLAGGVLRTRRLVRESERQARRSYEDLRRKQEESLGEKLFEAQVKRKREEEAIVVDAEFKPLEKQAGRKEQ